MNVLKQHDTGEGNDLLAHQKRELGITGVPVLVEFEDLLVDETTDSTNSWHVFWGHKPLKLRAIKMRENCIDVHLH